MGPQGYGVVEEGWHRGKAVVCCGAEEEEWCCGKTEEHCGVAEEEEERTIEETWEKWAAPEQKWAVPKWEWSS